MNLKDNITPVSTEPLDSYRSAASNLVAENTKMAKNTWWKSASPAPQKHAQALYTAQMTYSHIFRELVPGLHAQREGKRGIELHLDDIMSRCSLRDLYHLKEVYTRNMYCSITGVLLEIRDADIAANYLVSNPLKPSTEPTSINETADEYPSADTESSCSQLLRFSKFTPPRDSKSFYQRAMPRSHQVTHCSVSEHYIVYTVAREAKAIPEFQLPSQSDPPKQTLLVVIDITQRREIVLLNPSASAISAVYVDESILMVGSGSSIYHMKPRDLFVRPGNSASSARKHALFEHATLSGDSGVDSQDEIYAFWHTKGQTKVDVYTKSKTKTLLSIYVFHTAEGLEKLRLAEKRRSLRRTGKEQAPNDQQEIPQVRHHTTLDLNEDFRLNRRLRKQYSQVDQSYKHSKTHVGESDSMQSESDIDDEEREDRLDSLMQDDSSDDEGYVSGQGSDDEEDDQNVKHEKKDQVGVLEKKLNKMTVLDSSKLVLDQSHQSEPDSPAQPGFGKKLSQSVLTKSEQMALQSKLSLNHSQSGLREPFLPKAVAASEPDNQQQLQQVTTEFGYGSHVSDIVTIQRIKFHRRNTIVFRSDGHIDFIGSSNVVYSSRNIDFKKMKWEPITPSTDVKERQSHAPKIVDVTIDEQDLLLITSEKKVYLFSLDKMIVSLMKISVEQARLFSYHNRLQLFSNYLVFDNKVMVCHQNMVSICDINARVCKKKSWRHLSQPQTPIQADDRDTFDNEEARRDPFRVCSMNVRLIKMRHQDEIQPRVLVLFYNNVIRLLVRDANMRWQYDTFTTKLVHGKITEVICSRKADSLVLLRHKTQADDATSTLTVFYVMDSTEDLSRWKVMEGLQDHQRVIQISLQGRFMQNLSEHTLKPKIAVYDSNLHNLVVHQLQLQGESQQQRQNIPSSMGQSYGVFVPIMTIGDFRVLPTDIVTESGSDAFFYLGRQNKIYRCFVDEQQFRKVAFEKYDQGQTGDDKQLALSDEHPKMELMAAIASRYQKYTATINDFRIMEDNRTTYVYASTRTNIYFNQIAQFGKLFSSSKLFAPQLARQTFDLYVDDFYGQFSFFSGPFEISVLPFLSSNRISLRGSHQEPSPIFYQTRGYDNCSMLTSEGEVKTWDTNTGKLKQCVQLDKVQFYGYQRMNYFRNRTILCRQSQRTLNYEYMCVEIISNDKVKVYAKVVSPDYMNFYINCNDDLMLTEHRGQKHNVFEVTEFDKRSGQIGSVIRTFNRNIPMNFLSPSFYHYIDVESHTHRIRVLDTLSDKLVCVLPQHLYKFMCSKNEQFMTDTFVNKIIFIDEDFILMELNGSNEVIFHVPSRRSLSSFNNLHHNLKYNERFMPTQFDFINVHQNDGTKSMVSGAGPVSNIFGLKRQSTAWISPKEAAAAELRHKIASDEFSDPVRQWSCKRQMKQDARSQSQGFPKLQDFMYQNMKRQRHLHFFDQHSVCTVIRDKSEHLGDRNLSHMRLVSVRPFSYMIWKLMEDICSDKILSIGDLNKHQLALVCFAILPDSYGSRIRSAIEKVKGREDTKKLEEQVREQMLNMTSTPTLLHKLTMKNPEQIKPLIERMSKEWNKLHIPHINNYEGNSPIVVAHQNHNRRVLGWYLDMLSKYPFGYCQYQVAELIVQIISKGFEAKIGSYLDSRLIRLPWTQFYQTGRLKVSREGRNFTTVNNWPSRTQNFESKFFSEDSQLVPVYLHLLDCANLHHFSGKHNQKLLLNLVHCDISIFSHKSIQALLEYTWEQTRCAIIGWLFLPFIGYVVLYMYFLELLFKADTMEVDGGHAIKHHTMLVQFALLIFAVYFIQLHTRQIILQGCHLSTDVIWSSVDLVPLLVNVVSICIQVGSNYDGNYLIEIQKPIYACATLFLFLKMFYFLRYFREIGHLVRMIFNVMYLMRYFFVVFFCFIFTFACAFYAFSGGQNFSEQLLFVFFITIRKSDTSWFHDGYELLLWTLFLTTSMFFTYIILNITVSMVKGFYDANMRIKTESMFNVMTQLTLDCYPFIRTSEYERALQPPEGSEEFVADAEYADTKKSRFDFKLRTDSLCNQYLLLAETEQEEGKTLSLTDVDTPMKELQMQVNQGFNRVHLQLKHQDEILQKQKSSKSEDKKDTESKEFDVKVQQAVDERMKDVTERHAQEIADLKESQQEILSLLKTSLAKTE